jgi:Ferric reductase like transmembrane component
VLALTSPYLWYTTRATGLVTMILFTLVVTLGTLVANRVGGARVGRFELNELHRSISMVAIVFLVIHIATTVLDSFVKTGLVSAFIPMTSAYKRVPVALGAVALDLMLAVWISSLMKARVANRTWRFIHWFSWLGFATSIVHAVTVGTDAHGGVGLALVVACGLAGTLAGAWRFWARPTRAAGRTALSPLSPAPAAASPRPRPAAPARPAPAREFARSATAPGPARPGTGREPERPGTGREPFPHVARTPQSRKVRR